LTTPRHILDLRARIGHDLLLCPAVAAVIPDGHGRILFQEKSGGEGWSLPAGLMEPGEAPERALLREVAEETGLIVRVRRLLGAFGGKEFRHVYPNGDVVELTILLYLCDAVGETHAPLDPETKSLQYFGKDDMPRLQVTLPLELLFATD
jgi:8-oxo-dGTP pyrophosphatase MutT (NUDIX family)